MAGSIWFILLTSCFIVLAYHRAALIIWTLSFAIFLFFLTRLSHLSSVSLWYCWILFLVIFVPLQVLPWRRRMISQPILNFYRKIMPSMSNTEKEALAAGSVTWEGDLFCGAPRWDRLFALPKAQLSAEEQAFLAGPVEKLCCMIDDWEITHHLADCPPEVWKFIREQGFFGLIIPKEYGGKAFSAYAHSQILVKVYGRSTTVASTIAVPNSLGPAELILHYGSKEQKDHYLPRLASGEEIPCFALTGPEAGSDAGAIPDTGVVTYGEYNGKKVLGIRLNFNKRYITLAPVATVIGLAFKLYDPEQLISKKTNLGITCALIPRETKGVTIGRRHFPLNVVFQNGPIQGKDVFIPVDWIIGGTDMAGHGWRMLMECLAAGRAISLPASSTGCAKVTAYATGAYARVRRQFNTAIGHFEGIEEALTRIAGLTYLCDAARTFAAASIDAGEKPAIASAIIKYHVTELGRTIANDGMDVHGGKGICLGPKNYLGRGYEAVPIAITVEGANILTRSMIIFGQGAMRCHPYIFAELEAAKLADAKKSLMAFDQAIMGHAGYLISHVVRSIVLSVTNARFVMTPHSVMKRSFQLATRLSASFALIADFSLILLGGSLKRKEKISARLGDILSYLYLLSAVLKHYHDDGEPLADLPIVKWVSQTLLYEIQQKFSELLQNFPNRFLSGLLSVMIFPYGKNFKKPDDKLGQEVAQLLQTPSETRDRLTEGVFATAVKENVLASVEDALIKAIAAEPIEKIIKNGLKAEEMKEAGLMDKAKAALKQQLITEEQYGLVDQADKARQIVIAVDDFAPGELGRK